MEQQNIINAKNYLAEFDKILCEMENKMLSRKIVGNITIDFIECMIPHHEAAIYMCQNLLKYTVYYPLIGIAQNIVETQTKGIEQMREIEKTTRGYKNSRYEVQRYMTKYLAIVKNMVNKMKESPRCMNISLDFIGEMIPHHEGAIGMCNNLIMYRIDPRLRGVAQSIIKEQSKGVKEMEEVKKSLCNQM